MPHQPAAERARSAYTRYLAAQQRITAARREGAVMPVSSPPPVAGPTPEALAELVNRFIANLDTSEEVRAAAAAAYVTALCAPSVEWITHAVLASLNARLTQRA